jgi:hypothetical protein
MFVFVLSPKVGEIMKANISIKRIKRNKIMSIKRPARVM